MFTGFFSGTDAPRHKEFEAITKISYDLNESLALKEDKEYQTSEYISVFMARLVFNRKFESVFCNECSAENKAINVSIESWSEGERLYAQGGRQVSCKNGHLLFSMMEWNS